MDLDDYQDNEDEENGPPPKWLIILVAIGTVPAVLVGTQEFLKAVKTDPPGDFATPFFVAAFSIFLLAALWKLCELEKLS